MALSRNPRSEDQFLCSICLDVFTDPVTTPCGHNFCKSCITQHWDVNVLHKCPVCKETFGTRPQLKVNTFIREMVAKFRREAEQNVANPADVLCDFCTGTKLKALKSCLVCRFSYCETHLEPHLEKRGHQLVEPVENLEDRICTKHDKPLELFCRTDQTCVCSLCTILDHKTHEFVPLREEYEGKKVELAKTEAEIQQMIQKRQLKIQEIRKLVKVSKDAGDSEKAEGVQIFTDLRQSVERGLKKFIKEMEDKQKTTEKQAEDFIKDLEEEISELKKRSSEVEQLSHSEDHLHLCQQFSSLKDAPPTKNWTEISVHPLSYGRTVVKAVDQLEKTLGEKMKKLLTKAKLRRVLEHEVDVSLDPGTAHCELVLSADGKQVYHSDVRKNVPDNPERFSTFIYVLGKQSFSSGRFYFEVQVKGKTSWSLGVAKESINRKGVFQLRPQSGYWTVSLRVGNEYRALTEPPLDLHLRSGPEKVGVFVDYEKGLVSFYDVGAPALIYSFTGCSFTEQLYPFFGPSFNDKGKNSAPLIICPVNQTV